MYEEPKEKAPDEWPEMKTGMVKQLEPVQYYSYWPTAVTQGVTQVTALLCFTWIVTLLTLVIGGIW